MAKMADSIVDDNPLSRWARLWMLVLGWWPLPDYSLHNQERATKAFRWYRKTARWGLLVSAVLLVHAYLCLVTAQSTLDFLPANTRDVVLAIFPPTSGLSVLRSWLQAQITAHGSAQVYFVFADLMRHREPTDLAGRTLS